MVKVLDYRPTNRIKSRGTSQCFVVSKWSSRVYVLNPCHWNFPVTHQCMLTKKLDGSIIGARGVSNRQ